MPLTSGQRKKLRALAHHLDPVVLVGGAGITDGVVGQVKDSLEAHELIKVKFADGADARELTSELAQETEAEVAQVIGRIGVLYKRRKKEPAIRLG